MSHWGSKHRRHFLKTTLGGGAAAALATRLPVLAETADQRPGQATSRVALTAGDDLAENTFRGLRSLDKEIAEAIGNRSVLIKPNNVAVENQLSATNAATLEAILEFLKSINKLKNHVVIAESAGTGPTMEGFVNYGYPRVAAKYGVKLLDFDEQPHQLAHVLDEKDFRPHAVRTSKLLYDRNCFIISAAKMKTHDCVVATLSLKNIVFGAPLKDRGFRFANRAAHGPQSDKIATHGSGLRALNFNLFTLAQRLHPDLAIIDGFQGMEGNGPVQGTAVDHRVCVVSRDWLAADRVGVELMGIDFARIGYLNYCAKAGLGEADLSKIEVVGEPIARHVKKYKLADNIEEQMIWKKPPAA